MAIEELERLYEVTFDEHRIETLLTCVASRVDSWIRKIKDIHRHRLNKLVVGLDVEWRPNTLPNSTNPVAILQLCVGHRCLIFQLLHAQSIPSSLFDFLDHSDYTFAGVGIQADMQKLKDDYGLRVAKGVDLAELAANTYSNGTLRQAGLKGLARGFLGMEVEKHGTVRRSDWAHPSLSDEQVHYACVDAFVSFQLGKFLNAYSYNRSSKCPGRIMAIAVLVFFYFLLFNNFSSTSEVRPYEL